MESGREIHRSIREFPRMSLEIRMHLVPLYSTMTPSSLPLDPLAAPAFDSTPDDRGGPLSGMRVLDCSIAMAGPLAAMRLGDLGADVIKIEPVTGEWQRHVAAGGATGNRINASFLSLNRNKRSLAVDLKTPEGRESSAELVAHGRRLPAELPPRRRRAARRRLRDAARAQPATSSTSRCPGYGETGPYADRPGQDLLAAGDERRARVGRARRRPAAAAPGSSWPTRITAYVGVRGRAGRAAAPRAHRRGSARRRSTCSTRSSTLQMQELSVFTVGGRRAERARTSRTAHSYIRSPYGIFATQDGLHRARLPVDPAISPSCSTRPSSRASTTRSTPGSTATEILQVDAGAPAHGEVGRLARGLRGARHLGRAGLRLRGRPRRRAGRAQRHVRRV